MAPIGSYNGEVGVPLTVFTAEYGTRYLIIEMGATGIGHIEYLASMVKPDVGVVLGVGTAHAGEFGGVERIAQAKAELPSSIGPEGCAILNADDPRVLAMESGVLAQKIYFTADDSFATSSGAVVRAERCEIGRDGHPEFQLVLPGGGSFDVRSRLLGRHQVTNLLAAASIAHTLGIPGERIARALSSAQMVSRWRMERTERADGVTIINDAYNANPESMRAALGTLAELGRGRRTWAVLGEMLELGEDSISEHDALGRVAVRFNISKLIVVGNGARAMHSGAVLEGSWGDEAVFVEDAAAAEAILRAELLPGDLVLLKSSNAAGLRFLGDRIALASNDSTAVPDDHADPLTDSSASGRTNLQGGTKP